MKQSKSGGSSRDQQSHHHNRRDKSRSPHNERRWSRSSSRERKIKARVQSKALPVAQVIIPEVAIAKPTIKIEDINETDMSSMFGFADFSTTKGKNH